jgi:hypothetical protein
MVKSHYLFMKVPGLLLQMALSLVTFLLMILAMVVRRFTNQAFRQPIISSIVDFVNTSFYQSAIVLNGHFINWLFHYWSIS